MKLPQIGYRRQITSLGRTNIMGPVFAAREVGQAAERVGRMVQDISQIYLDRKNDAEIKEANSQLLRSEENWKLGNADKYYYTAEEIDPSLEIPRTESINGREVPRAKIPADEVQAEMYRTHMMKRTEELAQGISRNSARQLWLDEQNQTIDTTYSNLKLSMLSKQKERIRSEEKVRVGEYVDLGKFDQARSDIGTSVAFTEFEKGQMLEEVDKKQEEWGYTTDLDATFTENPEILKATVAKLQSNLAYVRPDNEAYDGDLTMTERATWANKMRQRIAKATAVDDDITKQQKSVARYRVNQLVQAIKSGRGEEVDPDVISGTMALTRTILADDPTYGIKLMEALEYGGEYAIFSRDSLERNSVVLDSMKKNIRTAADALRYNDLEQIYNNKVNQLDRNALDYYANHVKPMPPLDFTNFQSLTQSLQIRAGDAMNTMSRFGRFNGFLREAEIGRFNNMIENFNTDQQLAMFTAIENGLGVNSTAFYEQLKQKSGGSFAIAGELSSFGQVDSARKVLAGGEIRAATPEVMGGTVKRELNTLITDTIGTAYSSNAIHRKHMQEAIYNAYAYLSKGDMSGEYDDNRGEQAIQMVTGGVIEYNNSKFSAPVYGMTTDAFEGWMENLQPEYVDSLGKAVNYTSKQILIDLREGRLQLVDVGHNEYVLYDARKDQAVNTTRGDIFIFKYDTSYVEPVEKPAPQLGPRSEDDEPVWMFD